MRNCLIVAWMAITAVSLPAAESWPNIVVIMADDLGYGSLCCYGSKEINTPNIDRLAAKGMRFEDFHSSGPMCTPTRAALMTGRYPQRFIWVPDKELSPVFVKQRRVNMKQRWAWGLSLDELTIAEVLQKAGYKTALFGKWHLGYDAKFHPMNHGFDEFRGFIAGAVDYHSHQFVSGLRELDWWDNKTSCRSNRDHLSGSRGSAHAATGPGSRWQEVYSIGPSSKAFRPKGTNRNPDAQLLIWFT